MYVTRPLSLYKSFPNVASDLPPEGPHSGYLVIQDEAYEAQTKATCCGMTPPNPLLANPPFPQNRLLFLDEEYEAVMVPVPGVPLSANRYYVVVPKGKFTG